VSTPAEPEPRRWIDTLHASHERLVAFVADLSPADLRRQSYDDDWSVAQVLSHLGSQAEIFGTFLDAGLAGRTPPGNESFPPVWDAWNARDPDQQAHDALRATTDFIHRLRSLDDDTLTRPITLFAMPMTIGGIARLRLGEHALHSWDIMVSFDDSAVVAPDSTALLIDAVPALVARAGKSRPDQPPFVIRVRTSEPQRDVVLAVAERVALRPFEGDAVDGNLDLPAEALVRLAYGRLDAAHTPPHTFVSQRFTLDDLRAVFPGL
jgi:uncharacterized protein (TIGR03083 family)